MLPREGYVVMTMEQGKFHFVKWLFEKDFETFLITLKNLFRKISILLGS
jgi:hypothetical protein